MNLIIQSYHLELWIIFLLWHTFIPNQHYQCYFISCRPQEKFHLESTKKTSELIFWGLEFNQQLSQPQFSKLWRFLLHYLLVISPVFSPRCHSFCSLLGIDISNLLLSPRRRLGRGRTSSSIIRRNPSLQQSVSNCPPPYLDGVSFIGFDIGGEQWIKGEFN